MDILDTFGDWVQLFLCIGGTWFLLPALHQFYTRLLGLPNLILISLIIWVAWKSVYDYDLVIGYLIGGILAAIQGSYNARVGGDRAFEAAGTSAVITGVLLTITMIIKIVLFW